MSLASRHITFNAAVVREGVRQQSSSSAFNMLDPTVAMFVLRHPKHGVVGVPDVSHTVAIRRSSNKEREAYMTVFCGTITSCHERLQ